MPTRRQALRGGVAVAGGAILAAECRCGPKRGSTRRGEGGGDPGARPSAARGATGGQPFEAAYLALERSGKLKRLERALFAIYEECRLCPRQCRVNRAKGETGVCRATAELRLASAGPHFGEERPLVSPGGSGTIFFSHCNLRCCFCQNWEINHRGDGRLVTKEELARVMVALQERGCANINLVTPTHVVPNLVAALRLAIRMGLRIPLVYNTGGYDDLEVVKALDGVVDLYLPDFKYQDGAMAARYSSGAKDYPEVAAAGIAEMHRQVGRLRLGPGRLAERGLIIRHLVMPGNVAGTDRFVTWVKKTLGPDTAVNLMDQYHPAHRASEHATISRGITREEWAQALAWAKQAGLRNLL